MEYSYRDELYHHGILGQKWGKKNGPPYPLNPSDHSTSEKKAGWQNSLDKYSKFKIENLSDEQKNNIKKALKYGAIVVGTGLAIYGGYKLYGSYIGKGSAIDPETGFRLLKKSETSADSLSKCNPGRINWFGQRKGLEIITGSSDNCMLCTTNYELRQRGFDTAAGFSTTGYDPDELFPKLFMDYKGTTDVDPVKLGMSSGPSMFRNLFLPTLGLPFNSKERSDVYNNIIESIDKMSETTARGNIIVHWRNGGGHSMIWEKRSDGIHFLDGQINKEYTDFANEILKDADRDMPVRLLRTDNLTIDTNYINQYIRPDTTTKTYVDHGAEIVARMMLSPEGSTVTAAAITGAYVGKVHKDRNNHIVNEYRKKHPNSELSDKEILNNYNNRQ